MSATRDILNGVRDLITAAGLGIWTTGVPLPTDTPIVFKTMPDSPDRVIVLNVIPQTDNPSMPFGQALLQVACRGLRNRPLDVDDISDPIFDLLQGLTNQTFADTTVVQFRRISSVPMGQDDTTRWERADHFMLDVDYPPTILRPVQGAW